MQRKTLLQRFWGKVTSYLRLKPKSRNIQFYRASSYPDVSLPVRGTLGSAGYDFFLPEGLQIDPGETVVIPTGVCVTMPVDVTLLLALRSSMHGKLSMPQGFSIIDSDAYVLDISGKLNISIVVQNISDKTLVLREGERIAQGVFIQYLKTVDDKPTLKYRTGLFGSTGK